MTATNGEQRAGAGDVPPTISPTIGSADVPPERWITFTDGGSEMVSERVWQWCQDWIDRYSRDTDAAERTANVVAGEINAWATMIADWKDRMERSKDTGDPWAWGDLLRELEGEVKDLDRFLLNWRDKLCPGWRGI
jgi:hypothetical protein